MTSSGSPTSSYRIEQLDGVLLGEDATARAPRLARTSLQLSMPPRTAAWSVCSPRESSPGRVPLLATNATATPSIGFHQPLRNLQLNVETLDCPSSCCPKHQPTSASFIARGGAAQQDPFLSGLEKARALSLSLSPTKSKESKTCRQRAVPPLIATTRNQARSRPPSPPPRRSSSARAAACPSSSSSSRTASRSAGASSSGDRYRRQRRRRTLAALTRTSRSSSSSARSTKCLKSKRVAPSD